MTLESLIFEEQVALRIYPPCYIYTVLAACYIYTVLADAGQELIRSLAHVASCQFSLDLSSNKIQ